MHFNDKKSGQIGFLMVSKDVQCSETYVKTIFIFIHFFPSNKIFILNFCIFANLIQKC